MMVEERGDSDDINVMMMTAGLAGLVIIISVIAFWLLTGNSYLGADYIIETFFGAPNVYADQILSNIAASDSIFGFAVITSIVIVDNLSKILIISFILAAVFDIISYKSIDNFINKFRARGLSRHVIICRYNRVSAMLAKRLAEKGMPFVFIEDDPEKIVEMGERGIHLIIGDFKSSRALREARVERAKAVVLTSQNDLDNILGAIAARKLNKKIKIISRVGNDEAVAKMRSIGVDVCMIVERLVGEEVADFLVKAAKK